MPSVTSMSATSSDRPIVPDFLAKLGVNLPVIQAPMAGVQGSRLAVAVCQAGALGSLPCTMLSVSQIEQEVASIRSQTDGAFNLNFFAHPHSDYTPAMQSRWYQVLAPYYAEFGLDEADIATTGGRQPFGHEQVALLTALNVPVISFHFGLPAPALLKPIKDTGAIILASATTVAEAKWLVAHGADAIIAQGLEAGGHRSMFLSHDISTQSGTFSLLPMIARAVSGSVPVIAAGGISDSTTAAAAFGLGASAIQVGTALLLADECDTKPFHRAALQSEAAYHTALTNGFSGGYARGIVNRFIRETGGIHPDAPPFPHASFVTNPIKTAAEQRGSTDFSPLWAGQNAPLANAGSTKTIIDDLIANKH